MSKGAQRSPVVLGALVIVVVVAVASFYVGRNTGNDENPISTPTPTVVPTEVTANGCWNAPENMVSGYPQWDSAPNLVIDKAKTYTATIETNRGNVVVELFDDVAPVAVNNFICLAESGYYNFVPFHRVISGFMVQSGDPTGTGRGGPGYQFADELPGADLNYEVGTLAMANSGANTNGSQFFVVQGDSGTSLPKNYTIFGKVLSGIEIVDKIAAIPVGPSASGEISSPLATVGIITITIAEK